MSIEELRGLVSQLKDIEDQIMDIDCFMDSCREVDDPILHDERVDVIKSILPLDRFVHYLQMEIRVLKSNHADITDKITGGLK